MIPSKVWWRCSAGKLTMYEAADSVYQLQLRLMQPLCVKCGADGLCVLSTLFAWWLGNVMVTELGLRLNSREFSSRPQCYRVTTLGKLLSCSHSRAYVTKQYKLLPVRGRWFPLAGKVTVGLASHWPCIADFCGLSTYGLTAYEREISTPPVRSMAPLYLYLLCAWRLSW